jgi:hypothetical protein
MAVVRYHRKTKVSVYWMFFFFFYDGEEAATDRRLAETCSKDDY